MFKFLTALILLASSSSAFAGFEFHCDNDEGWSAKGIYDNVSHGRANLTALYTPDGSRPLQYGLSSQRNSGSTMTLKVNVYNHGQIVLYCELPR